MNEERNFARCPVTCKQDSLNRISKEVLEFVRGYLLKKLEPATASAMIKAISENTPILPNIDQARYKKTMQRVMSTPVAKKLWAKEQHKVNTKLILEWLSEDRPDLASVIINWPGPKGYQWLDSQVEQIKHGFLGIS